jgi:hypothetical protein
MSNRAAQTATWAVALALSLGSAIAIVIWLERARAPGAGGLWLAATVALGGVGVDLARRRHGVGATCATGPRLRPLQVSGLALQAVGIILYQSAQSEAFTAALPALTAPWMPVACIVGGVLALGIISTTSDCRDAELRGRV